MRKPSLRRNTIATPPDPAPTRVAGEDTTPLQRIRQVRLECGVTVRHASQALGLTPPAYRELEQPHTDVRLRNVHALARAFGVSIAELIVPTSPEHAKFLDFQQHGKLRQVMRILAQCHKLLLHEDDHSSENLFNAMEELLKIDPSLSTIFPHSAMEELLKIDPSLSTIFPHSLPAHPHHRTRPGAIPGQQQRELHRIASVMKLENVSRRTAQTRFNSASPAAPYVIREEGHPEANYPLSRIYTWAEVLDVPPAELLVDSGEDGPVAEDVRREGGLILVVKSVKALLDRGTNESVEAMLTQALQSLGKLVDPALLEVTAFSMMSNGGRESGEMGRITNCLYSDPESSPPRMIDAGE